MSTKELQPVWKTKISQVGINGIFLAILILRTSFEANSAFFFYLP